MATDANTLYEESKCYLCAGVTQAEALKLALEARWLLALDPTADTSVDGLTNYGKCYACLGLSLFDLLEISMLDQISLAV